MGKIIYYREETTQGVAFLKSEIRCSISSKKVLCITKKKNRPTLRYILKKVGSKWMNATGWSCYTCKGQTESDRLVDCLYKAAEQILKNQVIRTDYDRDGDPDWEENFYILRHSLCPAVLVEQFFMDNKKDLAYLISDEGKRNLIDVIVGGLEVFCSLSFPFHEH